MGINLSETEKEKYNKYFSKELIINKMLDVVRLKYETVAVPFGNFNSDSVIIVNFDTINDKVLSLINKYYSVNSKKIEKNFFSFYYTQLNKTPSDKINRMFLFKELEAIKPKRIIFLGVEPLDFIDNSIEVKHLTKEKLETFLKYQNAEESKDNEQYELAKKEFVDCLNYAIL